MNLELERFLENQTEMLGNLTITDSIDVQTLTDICEEYHKRKLKLLGIANVSNSACPKCKSIDIKTALHTDCEECNKCYHFWEADC